MTSAMRYGAFVDTADLPSAATALRNFLGDPPEAESGFFAAPLCDEAGAVVAFGACGHVEGDISAYVATVPRARWRFWPVTDAGGWPDALAAEGLRRWVAEEPV